MQEEKAARQESKPQAKGKSEPVKKLWGRVEPYIKKCVIPTGVLTGFWLVLGWLGAAGVNWEVLRFLAFLTGAYNGSEGHFISGTVGRAIYIMCINQLFVNVVVSRKSGKEKRAAFLEGFKEEVLKKIPQYENFKYFFEDRDTVLLGSGVLGIGVALLTYPLITAGGAAVNTSVCLLVAAVLLKELASDSGLVMAGVHLMLRKKPFSAMRREAVDRFLSGAALGMALSVVVALCSSVRFLAVLLGGILPWALVLGGLAGIFFVQLTALAVWIKERSRSKKGEGGK